MPDLPGKVQRMLDRGHLREQEFITEQVAGLWAKAVTSAGDAELPGLSVEGALRAAYEAGHTAVLALLAAHGVKTASGRGHHEAAFAAAAALEHEGLDDLVVDSSEIRSLRQSSLYDPAFTDEADRERAVAWMRRTLPAIRQALVSVDSTLASRMENYPKSSEST
ncbi:MAG: hypothetical protein WEB88_15645 [Gemmatimonadota bacterium]